MELIVGTNSYMTLEEANNFIATRFVSSDPVRKFWEQLSEEDKVVIIITTTERYDTNSMLYRGNKVMITQPLQFPRIDTYKQIVECPDRVKVGLLLQGIRDTASLNSEIEQMREMGIHSFSDGGGASVTFENSNSSNYKKIKTKDGIYRDLWTTYFSEYSYLC